MEVLGLLHIVLDVPKVLEHWKVKVINSALLPTD
jgi:hypothetical protein